MKNLQNYNVQKLNKNELRSTNGGGLGVWFAKAIDAAQGAVYDLFAGQYNHVGSAVSNYQN
jgi:hypothetical protein